MEASRIVLSEAYRRPAQSLRIDEGPREIIFRTAFAPRSDEEDGIARTISNGAPLELEAGD